MKKKPTTPQRAKHPKAIAHEIWHERESSRVNECDGHCPFLELDLFEDKTVVALLHLYRIGARVGHE